MKKYLIAFISLMSLALTACPGSNSGSNGQNNINVNTQATTPLNPHCLNGTAYCPQYNYNAYYQYGWMAYPYYYSNTASNGYFCACPAGYSPSYNPSWGLGCLSNTYLTGMTNYLAYWNTSSYYGYTYYQTYTTPVYTNNSLNIPQVSNMQSGAYATSCQAQPLTQACFVNQANSCSNGQRCAPTASGSPLGVCIL